MSGAKPCQLGDNESHSGDNWWTAEILQKLVARVLEKVLRAEFRSSRNCFVDNDEHQIEGDLERRKGRETGLSDAEHRS